MILYEYLCPVCGSFDELAPLNAYTVLCSGCGRDARRQIQFTSFALKGGGWAQDGYSTTEQGVARQSYEADKLGDAAREQGYHEREDASRCFDPRRVLVPSRSK